jgi:hypothetical protein
MRNVILVSLSLVQLVACAASRPNRSEMHNYSRAIAEAEVQTLNRRNDLRECVVKWQRNFPIRTRLLEEVLSGQDKLKDESVLLEISSSGGVRYDYVYVEKAKLKSSFDGAEHVDISGTALEKHLNEVSTQELSELTGRAFSSAVDAPCYFLSMKKGNSTKTVAVYGSLATSGADSLIKELLAAVGVRNSEPLLPALQPRH